MSGTPGDRWASGISFRPAHAQDFRFCAKLYFAWMGGAFQESDPEVAARVANLRERWEVTQVRIITRADADIGWLQSTIQDDAHFLVQLFIDTELRGQGIGTEVMHRIIEEARTAGRPVTLGVIKSNPALRLYGRLGFEITHEDDRKYYMRRDFGATETWSG